MMQILSMDAHRRSLRGFRTLLVLLTLLLPAGSRAAFEIRGVGNPGETVKGYACDWTMIPGGRYSPETVTMTTCSNLNTNWWMAVSSETPWDTYLDETQLGVNPTVHWIDEINGGDAFFLAMTFDYQLNQFSSGIRLANDLFVAGTNFHIGFRNLGVEDGDPVDVLGSLPLDSEPGAGGPAEISGLVGLEYGGYSLGLGAGAPSESALAKAGWTTDQAAGYEWVKYTDNLDPVDGGPSDPDLLLHIQSLRSELERTNVTELVYFFDVAPGNPTIAADDWVENYGASTNPTDDQALNDLVMSWTINAKAKPYKADPPNPEYSTPYFPQESSSGGGGGGDGFGGGGGGGPPIGPGMPEPSRAVLILIGVLAVTWVRRRGPSVTR